MMMTKPKTMAMRLHILSQAIALIFARPALSAAARRGGTVWATPHDSFSSSIGVLGCKVNTDRVAYWPYPIDCNNICVSLEYENRKVYLLRVDQSQGAHDVSYDAWNYLYTGYSATDKPTAGGAVAMTTENVDASNCASLLHTKDNKLPLSAANSMNFLASCLGQPNSWVAKNYVLYNILDSICTLGSDETCTLDWPAANQAACPTTLGLPTALKGDPVYNILYPSGKRVVAGSGQLAPAGVGNEENMASTLNSPSSILLVAILSLFPLLYSWTLW